MVDPQDARRLGLGEISIVLLALLFPLGARFATGVGNIYLATAMAMIWLAAWALFSFAGPRGGLLLSTWPQRALFAYAVFIVLQVLLHLGSLVDRPSFLLRSVQLVVYLALFSTISSLSVGRRALRLLIGLSLAVLAFECAITWLPGHTSPVGFLTGTFDREHSSFAGYLLLMLSIVVACYLHKGSGYHRGSLALLAAAGFICLILSFSRAAYVATPIALLAILHRRSGLRAALVAVGILAAAIVLAGLVLPFEVVERFGSILEAAKGETSDVSLLTRFALWENAFSHLVRSGFLGVGPYGFHYLDNYYVRVLVETGPVGLGLFVSLLIALLAWLSRAHERGVDPEMRAIALGLYGATVGLLVVMSLSTDVLLIHRVMGLYWVLLGAFMAASRGLAPTRANRALEAGGFNPSFAHEQ